MKTQNRIAIILIIASILALVFQDRIWDALSSLWRPNDPRLTVASLDSVDNGVRYRLPESLTWRSARQNMDLKDGDTISTDADASAQITFKSGLKVQLEPNSLIIVHNYGGGPDSLELTFLKGGVKVLNLPAGIVLPAEKVSRPMTIAAQPTALPSATPVPLPQKVVLEETKKKPTPTPKPKRQVRETLPDAYIALVIREQRNYLNRCYAQHLRLNPEARGRIDTSLTIEPDGTISSARITGSTIPDPTLQQCVVSSLQRAKFRPYDGDPIVVNYPINFE